MSKKVLIVGAGFAYAMMFEQRGWDVVASLKDADLVQFLGGSDVSPNYYGEDKHPYTHCDTGRDVQEKDIFDAAVKLGIPIAGICRGGQFVHVMNGGKLWQHVDGHGIAQGHEALCKLSGDRVLVTSTHHQMMVGNVGEIVMEAVDTTHTFKERVEGGKVVRYEADEHPEVEAVYHKDTNSLSFQPHPEMCRKDSGCQDIYFEYLETLLGV